MKRKMFLLLLIPVLLSACHQVSSEVAWPTAEANATAQVALVPISDPAPLLPVIEDVPDFSTWEIGAQVTEAQQVYLNRLVEYAWYSYFSPYGQPDCEALLPVFSGGNPWNETVGLHCELMAEQGYFVMFPMLPAHAVSYFAFPDSPNEIQFVVRVDSKAPWEADVRYYTDGAQMGYMRYMRTIVDFHLVIEEGKLKIGMIDEFYLDADGAVWDRGENGDLVKIER